MPPLITVAGALGGLAALRWAYKAARQVNRELEELRRRGVAKADPASDRPTLKRDSSTGPYRPR